MFLIRFYQSDERNLKMEKDLKRKESDIGVLKENVNPFRNEEKRRQNELRRPIHVIGTRFMNVNNRVPMTRRTIPHRLRGCSLGAFFLKRFRQEP